MQRLSYDQRVYAVFGIDIGVFFKKAFLGNPKLRKPRRVFRLLTSDFRLATSNFRLLTSDFLPDSSVSYAGIYVQGQGSVEGTAVPF